MKKHLTNFSGKSIMESRDHFKNGASPKSQKNRRNLIKVFLIIGILCISFVSCKKDKNNGTRTTNVSSTIWNITSLSGTGEWFKQYSDDGVLTFDEAVPFKITFNTDKTCHATFLRDEKYNGDGYYVSSTGTWMQNNNSLTFNIVWKYETPEGVQVNEFNVTGNVNQKANVEMSGNLSVKGSFTGTDGKVSNTEGSGTFASKQESQVVSTSDVANTTWKITSTSGGDEMLDYAIGNNIIFNANHTCNGSFLNYYWGEDFNITSSTGTWKQNNNSIIFDVLLKGIGDDKTRIEDHFNFTGTVNSSENMSGNISIKWKDFDDDGSLFDSRSASGTFVATKVDGNTGGGSGGSSDGTCIPKVYMRTDWLKCIKADNPCDKTKKVKVKYDKLISAGRVGAEDDYWVTGETRTFDLRPHFYGDPILFPTGEVKEYRLVTSEVIN
jgi:hypothetical protein